LTNNDWDFATEKEQVMSRIYDVYDNWEKGASLFFPWVNSQSNDIVFDSKNKYLGFFSFLKVLIV
jgi:hypothetical protein